MRAFLSYLFLTLVAVLLLQFLKRYQSDVSFTSSVGITVFLLGVSLSIIVPFVDYINSIAEQYTYSYLSVLIKASGIALLTGTASDLCRSSGEEAIASKVELLGKCELLFLSLPLLQELFQLVHTIIEEAV